jgi:plastocyanin
MAAFIAIASFAACMGTAEQHASPAPAPTTTEATGDEVTMRLIAYRPDRLEVGIGTTVAWLQRDAGFHTVTSGTVAPNTAGSVKTDADGTFRSDRLATGERFAHTFEEEGTYAYFCEIHPATMTGTVEVQPDHSTHG